MAFYDFFSQQDVTMIGKRWMAQAANRILLSASRSVSPLRSVVELGPGWGALAEACGERRLNYVAVDASLTLLRRLTGVRSICSFVPPIPLGNHTCDLVVASHVLEHAGTVRDAQELIAEMKRVARKGGCLVIVSPDFLWAGKYFWDCDYSHTFPTSARRLHQLLLDQGVEVVKLEYVYNHLTGWKGYFTGLLTSAIPYRLVNSSRTLYSERLYRLRMTFSRSVLVIARVIN
jgi:SAM-dependent methyltransferase